MKQLDAYKALSFDFDDTLATLHVPWSDVYAQVKTMIETEFGPIEENLRLHQMVGVAQDLYGPEVKEKSKAILFYYEQKASYTVNVDLVTYVQGRHCPLAIYSNNCRQVLEHILAEIGLAPHVNCLVAFEDVSQFKPHPEGMEKVIKTLGVSVDDLVYVGDKETDKQVAESCGVPFTFVQELV